MESSAYHGKGLCRKENLDESLSEEDLDDLCEKQLQERCVRTKRTEKSHGPTERTLDQRQEPSVMNPDPSTQQLAHTLDLREISVRS
jgi:hypothetical protein